MEGKNLMEAKKVLVVEDDEPVRRLIKKLVEMRHATVTIIGSGKEANLLLTEQHNRYDLVFLDLILPEVTGWDILETLRSRPETKDASIISFTGANLSEKEKEKMLQKASAIIEKSEFTLKTFDALLYPWLEGCNPCDSASPT